jgi:acetyltransferase
VLADHSLALPPLNAPLARKLVSRTRVSRLLQGWHQVPPADIDALVQVLIKVSQLLAEVPQFAEIEINPLLLDDQGAVALDARLRVSAQAPGGAARFAIRPYPSDLAETLQWRGRAITVRPVRPEDEAQHRAFLERLDPDDIRMRIFYSRRTIERSELARLTQIDYEREMAFLATAPGADGREETLAVVRAVADPDNHDAEFGIIVRSDLKGSGLGRLLMGRLIAYQRHHGTQRLVATVLNENAGMLKLAQDLGFVLDEGQADASTRAIHLDLQAKV